MYTDKTQLDSSLDLSLYIEGLFQQDETEIETETRSETVESNGTFASEFEQDITEQSLIPLWGQKQFECLLVKSAGMKIIIPAMSVAYIENVNKKIPRLSLDTEAFHGVITLREQSVAVIDLFSLIAGNTSFGDEGSMQHNTHYIDHVIVMENGKYALACDDVSQMMRLNPEDVRWNRASFNNPMFIGVVTEHLCPIINIDNLYQQVATMAFVQSLKE